MEYFNNYFVSCFIISIGFTCGVHAIVLRLIAQSSNSPPGWTEKCIECICEGSSQCNQTVGCIRQFCGMFLIDREYWKDAGSPTLMGDDAADPGAFQRCANDPYCGSTAVNQYITAHSEDCNKDGSLSCEDYARLHFYGHEQCQTRDIQGEQFYATFQSCFNRT